ncbi:hypothetical protein [Labilibacter marinus]|uniref:hypothetical protein n=1 Tax=Labilibacter marinus TaxID=1477105 RepID=UPI000A790E86|nr:hypothetical protein [Labilibacter marinus]
MMKLYKLIVLTALAFFVLTQSNAQKVSHYNNPDFNPLERELYKPGINIHTSVRSYDLSRIEAIVDVDSLLYDGIKTPSGHLNFWKRILHDDLLQWDKNGVNIKINPLFDLGLGKEFEDGKNTMNNTRGFYIEGTFGDDFYFYTDFLENQAKFPNYMDAFIAERKVVPGQGKTKEYGTLENDYSQATGFISYSPGNWFNFQIGSSKHFIGDGYRSLLLSDNSYSYPYLKFSADFNKVHYHVMWAQHRDLNIDPTLEANDTRYLEKYSASQYLNFNIGNRLSLGLFESVVWAAQDTMGQRNFELAYLNPVIFFRPVEYSLGSPDNMTMGFNAKYIVGNNSAFYGQFVLGEFKFDEVFSGNKWWANKQGFQLGFKSFSLFGINKLDFLTEYNQVRPYTYSHRETITNYGHYNQELAHPLGANFRESITKVKYQYKRWIFNAEIMAAMYGKDFDDDVSYGKNIYKNNQLRPGDYGHFIGQGLKTNLMYLDGSVSYLINPRNNLNIAMGGRFRTEKNDLETMNTKMVWFAVRTSIKSIYTDF